MKPNQSPDTTEVVSEKKTKKETSTVPAVFIDSQKTAMKLFNGEKLQKEIAEFAKLCNEIEVKDETSAKKLTEMITVLNKLYKKGETEKKVIKKPYLDANSTIETVFKSIFGPAPEAVLKGKDKLIRYQQVLDAEKKKKEEVEAKKAREEEERIQKEADDAKKQISDLYTIQHSAIVMAGQCTTMDMLKAWHGRYSAPTTSDIRPELAGEFPDSVAQALKRMTRLKEARKAYLTDRKQSVWDAVVQEVITEINNEKNGIVAQIEEELEEETSELVVSNEMARIESQTQPKVPYSWDYSIADFSKVPDDWKMVNTDMVKEFLKSNKDTLADGTIHNGLLFKRIPKVVLR